MGRYQTIWERKTRNFSVTLAWVYEEDGDLSWDDTGEVRAKLESGEWSSYVFRVAVYDRTLGCEIASEYLGDSIHADPLEFIDHREVGRQNRQYAADGVTGRCGSYFSDMIANACLEARREYAKPRATLRAA